MAGTFTLHYFNAKGRAEPIRWMFAYTKTAYTDQRYTKDDWPTHKPKMPLGQLPVLDWSDGKQNLTLCQSASLFRFVAGKLDLAGKSPSEIAKADESFESIRELQDALGRAFYEQDPAKKEELMNKAKAESAPRILGFLEKRLKENGGKNLAGGAGYTYADFVLAAFMDMIKEKMDVSDKFPEVCKLAKTIADSPDVKAYLEKRPVTEH